ncbi:hypothetical protein SDC9_192654 [bioreactor metagenome]|uniref:Uncharacterized protein n=1 Tax=bioreactor metagenome TaxID=1076179 RepID=A0A645I1C2_9ZZZZ
MAACQFLCIIHKCKKLEVCINVCLVAFYVKIFTICLHSQAILDNIESMAKIEINWLKNKFRLTLYPCITIRI